MELPCQSYQLHSALSEIVSQVLSCYLGKVVLLRSVRGKLMTRIKRGKFSELKHFYAKNSSLEYGGFSEVVYTLQVQTKWYSKRACLLSILLGYRLKRRERRK